MQAQWLVVLGSPPLAAAARPATSGTCTSVPLQAPSHRSLGTMRARVGMPGRPASSRAAGSMPARMKLASPAP